MSKKTDLVFAERLAAAEDELKQLYLELYGDEASYDYFIAMLKKNYDERKAALRKLDEQRLADPGWFKRRDLLGVLMYVQAFGRDGKEWNGTLSGVRAHLDYLEETGINYLHLMPILESPEGRSDGGYAVSDFRAVDPKLGSMEDLSALADDCRRRGMSLCLDFVMNHTSEDHAWAKAARAGDPVAQARYFFYDDWTVPNEYEKTVPEVFPQTAPGNFTWCEEAGKVVMTTFYPYQWDLNYENPMVLNDMTDNMLFLCNRGVDVIRLDAVPYIWKEVGTTSRNLPQVHKLVRIMHLAADIVCPGTLLLGEVVMEPSKVVPYFGTVEHPECQMLYNVTTMASTWHTVATKDVRLLRHQLETVFDLPHQYTFLNYLRCHDDIGWGLDFDFLGRFAMQEVPHKKYLNDWFRGLYPGSHSRGELYNDDPKLGDARLCGTTASLLGMEPALESGDPAFVEHVVRCIEGLHAFLLTQSGIPVLYSGDELGQRNDWAYHDDPLKADDSRYLHRGNFDWHAAAHRHDTDTPEGAIYGKLQTLRKLRADHAVFSADADVWTLEPNNDHILGIGRYYEGEKLLALFNFTQDPETAWLPEGETFTDLLTGEEVKADILTLPGGGFRWLWKRYGA